jgi:hypothetical protein
MVGIVTTHVMAGRSALSCAAYSLRTIEIPKNASPSSPSEVKMLEPAYQAFIAQKQHTFLIRNEVFQNSGTLKRWKGNQPMRQRVKAIGNLPWEEQD